MSTLLVFTENYAKGGGNRYLIDLINGIAPTFESTLLASNVGGIFEQDIQRLSQEIYFRELNIVTRASVALQLGTAPTWVRRTVLAALIPVEPIFLLYNVFILGVLLARLRPVKVIACNGGYPAAQSCLSMMLAAWLLRIPASMSIVSMPTARRRLRFPYELLVDRLVWACANTVVVNANAIATALHVLRGMPIRKARVLYNGLEFRPKVSERKRPPGHFVLGCVARLDAAKGALVLFEAFVELARKYREIKLVLAGHGDASDELLRRAASQNLLDRVEFLGHFDGDVHQLLSGFDIYVFPSLWEGFPYSIVEALRASSVIVATRVGGIPEAITDGVDGVLVAPNSSEEIVQAVSDLIDNPARCATLSRNARTKFEQVMSIDRMHVRAAELLGGAGDMHKTSSNASQDAN